VGICAHYLLSVVTLQYSEHDQDLNLCLCLKLLASNLQLNVLADSPSKRPCSQSAVAVSKGIYKEGCILTCAVHLFLCAKAATAFSAS